MHDSTETTNKRKKREIIPSLFFDAEENLQTKGYMPILPGWYGAQEFKNDVLAMFQGRTQFFGKQNIEYIKNIKLRQTKTKNHYIEQTRLKFSIAQWSTIQRFFVKFPKSVFFKELKQMFNDYEASEWLISLLASRGVCSGQGYGGEGLDVSTAMQRIEHNDQNEKELIEWAQGQDFDSLENHEDGDNFSDGCGGGHKKVVFLDKARDIQKLLPKLKIKYRRAKKNTIKREESIFPSKDCQPTRIRNLSEISQVLSSDLILPDEMFYNKLITKDLRKLQHFDTKPESKKYTLVIDVSGSMSGTREVYALASAISLLENTGKSKENIAEIMFFDADVHDLISGSFDECKKTLFKTPFSGGGTNINKALKEASKLNAEEIILITDGRCSVDPKAKPQTSKLHTIFIGAPNKALEEISDSFECLDDSEIRDT